MSVRKLFWDDPYLTSCDAVVTGVDGDSVTLDRTVAFAFSGGQHSDAGTIAGWPILHAATDGLEIRYALPEGHGLRLGDPVRVEIDWPVRYRLMRLHFAAELVLEAVGRVLDRPRKVGADITPEKARIDFELPGNISGALPAVLAVVDELVRRDLPIESRFTDEASQRRSWTVEGFATVACGGTHPRRAGEVGQIALRRSNPGKGIERIEIRLADPGAGL